MKPLSLHKLAVFLLYSVCYLALYVYPNFFPLWQPRYLPMLPVDTNTPFLPWSFLIYTSDYLLIFSVIVMHSREEFNSFARMAIGVLFFCGMFFIFFPTTYPRPEYPEVSNSLIALTMKIVGIADKPTNCFPSQHVALTAVCAWSVRGMSGKVQAFFWIWAVAIFVSTLTTKQHYFYDILGGLTIAATVASLECLLFEKRYFYSLIAKVTVK